MSKKNIIGALIILALCLTIQSIKVANAKEVYSLEQAMRDGISTNPELSGVYNNQRAAEQRILQQRSRFFPSIDLFAASGYEQTDTPLINDQSLYQNQVSLSLTQQIFDGFETSNLVKSRQSEYQASEFRTKEAANLVAINIANSYLNVLRNRQAVRIAEENLNTHTDIYERIKEGAEAGRFNLGDLGQIETRMALSKSNLNTAAQSLEQSIANYKQNTGLEPSGSFQVPEFDSSVFPENVDAFIDKAKKISPTIQSFRSELTAAENNLRATRGDFYPQVNVELTGSKGDNLGGIGGSEDLVSALLVMRWNLFNGGLDKAEEKESLYLKSAAQDEAIAAYRLLEKDIRSIWAARNANLARIVDFQAQTQANKKLVKIYNQQFGIGRRTLLDLLDTQNSLFTARTNYINSVFNSLFSSYQLLALSGELTDYFSIASLEDIIVELQPIKTSELQTLTVEQARYEPSAGLRLKPILETQIINLGIFNDINSAMPTIERLHSSSNPYINKLTFDILELKNSTFRLQTEALSSKDLSVEGCVE